MEDDLQSPNASVSLPPEYSSDIDSCCSTPYVSAPSSPGRGPPLTGFYYSAPSSPMHFTLSKTYPSSVTTSDVSSFEFDLPATGAATADELFFNGQIRPMKLSTHLQRPQILDPLIESDEVGPDHSRGRDLNFRAGSLRRRTRSMSPLRNNETTSFDWNQDDEEQVSNNVVPSFVEDDINGSNETTPCASRSSSTGRSSSSKRWVFLKELLYRSKSEGRNNERHRFWNKKSLQPLSSSTNVKVKEPIISTSSKNTDGVKKKVVNKGSGKRSSPSPHEVHYTAKRAQAEEMRKRTFLPYRQGLLGCLGFSSKGYGAMNGFARALNHVSSS